MPDIAPTTPDDLREAIRRVDGWRRLVRLVAALLYASGHSGPEIAAIFDVREATVYAWLGRFEGAEDVLAAAGDRPRSGRPPRLDAEERAALLEDLDRPPGECGYPAAVWTPELVRGHLSAAFGVEYSLRHARRLLAEADGDRRVEDSPAGGQ